MKKEKKFSLGGALEEKLRPACRGLIYISETDAAIEPFFGDPQSPPAFLAELDRTQRTKIEEVLFEDFFDRLTAARAWHGEAEKKRVEKFKELQAVLKENLTGLRVFRIGEIRIDIYIVGLDPDGRLAGVKTNAVET